MKSFTHSHKIGTKCGKKYQVTFFFELKGKISKINRFQMIRKYRVN